jgi:hypothetical protein
VSEGGREGGRDVVVNVPASSATDHWLESLSWIFIILPH